MDIAGSGQDNMEILKQKILQKIENREIVAGVIGLGYVGLPLAALIYSKEK